MLTPGICTSLASILINSPSSLAVFLPESGRVVARANQSPRLGFPPLKAGWGGKENSMSYRLPLLIELLIFDKNLVTEGIPINTRIGVILFIYAVLQREI